LKSHEFESIGTNHKGRRRLTNDHQPVKGW
jgi:hypothetical protein